MKDSTENQAKGKLKELKGRVKEGVGVATGNADLANRGRGEKIAGKIQNKVGDVQKVLEN